MNVPLSSLRYMFEGGTNFGYWNGKAFGLFIYLKKFSITGLHQKPCGGKSPACRTFRRIVGAEHDTRFRPVVTSYDYDAPLSEAGDPTEKLFAIRDVIKLVLLLNLPPAEVVVRLYLCIFLRCD